MIVFADAKPGYEELLYECLKTNDYWLYVSQCIGALRCLAVYGIPAGKEKEFEGFISQLQEIEPGTQRQLLLVDMCPNHKRDRRMV